jgi:phosphoribosylanthranilate isomerase
VTLVKICGIRTLDEGRAALESGADMLGFMFYEPSKRFVPPPIARQVIGVLRAEFDDWFAVGVFVNPSSEIVRDYADMASLDYVQLHGDEAPEQVKAMPRPVIKALRVGIGDEDRVGDEVASNSYGAHTYLLDTKVEGQYGGTGQSFNWFSLSTIGPSCLVAGGLRPDNVKSALQALRPRGVDVSGGVEFPGGGKDPSLVRAFLEAVRSHDR